MKVIKILFFVMFWIILSFSSKGKLIRSNSVLMCMRFRIHHYVAAPLHYFILKTKHVHFKKLLKSRRSNNYVSLRGHRGRILFKIPTLFWCRLIWLQSPPVLTCSSAIIAPTLPLYCLYSIVWLHCVNTTLQSVNKGYRFLVPTRDFTYKLSLAGDNLIIPSKREFG